MAQTNPVGSEGDQALGQLEAFVAQLADTRRGLAARQAAIEARSDAMTELTGAAAGRFQSFHEVATGLAESLVTTSQFAGAELGRLSQAALGLTEQLRGPGADAFRAAQERFTAGVEGARAALDKGRADLAQAYADIEQAVDEGDEHAAHLVADQEAGFGDLAATVAEADASFSQADFDLQGMLEGTTAYIYEGLEQYMAAVFSSFFDHLETELPTYLTDLFQDLGLTVHRVLDDFDGVQESAAADMEAENEQASSAGLRLLDEHHQDGTADVKKSLDEMRKLLEEVERCRSSARSGTETCQAYPPIAPQLAAARQVAERVQEMTDVFNPFGS